MKILLYNVVINVKTYSVLIFSSAFPCCVESKSPDDELFKYLAHTYADNHPQMRTGNACSHDVFQGGVINGAYW